MKKLSMKEFLAHFVLPIVFICLVAIPGFWDILKPGHFTSHDGEGHIIRMDEFYRSFREGQFPVRWSKRLYYGYGYPFFNFNYPLIYYTGLPVMLLGGSATLAVELEMIVTFILSGIFMYGYLKRKTSTQLALTGAVLYMYAPYRLLNIYVRGSLAETAIFVFPPLILWAVEALAEKKKNSFLLTSLLLGLVGISHNIGALLFFVVYFAYSLFWSLAKKSFKVFLKAILAFLMGLAMASFFLVPALVEKQLTWLNQTIARDFPDHFLYPLQLIKGGWDYGASVAGPNDGLSFNLGWLILGLSLVAIFSLLLFRKKIKSKFLTTFFYSLLVIGVSIFFMFPVSRFLWENLPLLSFVQFPWRFIMVTTPVLSVLAVLGLDYLKQVFKFSKTIQMIILVLITGLSLFLARNMWHLNQPLYAQYRAGDAIEGTTTWADEQATQWLVPKPNKIPEYKVTSLDQGIQVEIDHWLAGKHEYTVTSDQPATIVEETMYYPGWRAWVDGQEVTIDYQQPDESGKIVFEVPAGQHQVVTKMTETPMRLAVDILSLLTLVAVLGLLLATNL